MNWLLSGGSNGVVPNNKQYNVTPNAQTSIAFVICRGEGAPLGLDSESEERDFDGSSEMISGA